MISLLLSVHSNSAEAILSSYIDVNGHQNGPIVPGKSATYKIEANGLTRSLPTLTTLAPIDLTSDDRSVFQSHSDQLPLLSLSGGIGSSIAKQILESFNLDEKSKQQQQQSADLINYGDNQQVDSGDGTIKLLDEDSDLVTIGQLNQKLPKAVLIYRENENGEKTIQAIDGKDLESMVMGAGSGAGSSVSNYEQQSNGDDDNDDDISGVDGEVSDDDAGGRIIKDEDNVQDVRTIVKNSKPGRLLIKRIVKDKDGELTAIDWIQDNGHKQHGWKNLYHKEEWGDTQSKNDLLNDANWKNRFTDDDRQKRLKSVAKAMLSKSNRKTQKSKRKKRKNRAHPDVAKDDDSIVLDKNGQLEGTKSLNGDHRIPQIVWNLLSRQNGQQQPPMEDLKVSTVKLL